MRERLDRAAATGRVEAATEQLPQSVTPLPYCRRFSPEQGVRWRIEVQDRGRLSTEPVIATVSRDHALVLDAAPFWADDDDGPATVAVRKALATLGVTRVIELREYGPGYEVAGDALSPTYPGAEGTFTADGAEWLVFASHKGVTAIGGTIVEPLREVWPAWADAQWRGWD